MGPAKQGGGRRQKNGRRRGARAGRGGGPSTDVSMPRAFKPWTCTRCFNLGPYLPVAADYGGTILAALNQLPAFAEFTALFQEYKYQRVDVEFTFLPAATERYTPTVWTANLSSAGLSAPSTLAQMSQLSGVRKFAFGPDKRSFRCSFVPKLRTSDTQYIMLRAPWISTGDAGAAHAGIGYWFQFFNVTTSPGAEIHVSCRHTLQLRGQY